MKTKKIQLRFCKAQILSIIRITPCVQIEIINEDKFYPEKEDLVPKKTGVGLCIYWLIYGVGLYVLTSELIFYNKIKF